MATPAVQTAERAQEEAEAKPEESVASGEEDRAEETLLPRLDIYFPEGRLDLRLSRLIKNAFFEGQIKYDFVRGDISAFLRYRYYAYRSIYQLSVFDSVEFEDVEDFDNDFERVRGALFLTEWPHDYHHRTFFLAEIDRLSSSKEELRFSNNRTDTFVRVGFQRGTPDDARSNAIVGETRARAENLFTAHRKIGPSGAGFTGALTYSFDFPDADFNYLKFEFEGLKRFDLSPEAFAVARVHGGTFPHKEMVREAPEIPESDRYSIPRSVLFRLDGRENLKGVGGRRRGTEEFHSTVEFFVPWFLNRNHRFLAVDWENFYWVFYGGYGTIGFDPEVYTDFDSYYPDLGFGFEATFKLKDYTFFISGLVAQAFRDDEGLESHISIKSYR